MVVRDFGRLNIGGLNGRHVLCTPSLSLLLLRPEDVLLVGFCISTMASNAYSYKGPDRSWRQKKKKKKELT